MREGRRGKAPGIRACLWPSCKGRGSGRGRVRGASKNNWLVFKPLASLSHTNWSRLVLPGQRAQGGTGHGVRGNFLKTDQIPSHSRARQCHPFPPGPVLGQGVPSSNPWPPGHSPTPLEPPVPGEGGEEAPGSILVDRKEDCLQLGPASLLCRGLPQGHRLDPRRVGQVAESHALLTWTG